LDLVVDDAGLHRAAARRVDQQHHALGAIVLEGRLGKAATTNSALASAPLAISPLISTTAVCGVVLSVLGAPR
jgi:hypothetical protein